MAAGELPLVNPLPIITKYLLHMRDLHFFKEGEVSKNSDIGLGFLGVLLSLDQGAKDTVTKRNGSKLPKTNHAFEEENPFNPLPPATILQITDPENVGKAKREVIMSSSDFQEMVESQTKKSGSALGVYQFQNGGMDDDLGLAVFTENGIACILFGRKERSSVLAVSGAIGRLVEQLMSSKRIPKEEAAARVLLDKYPSGLVAKFYQNSIFIPYEKINEATLDPKKSLLFLRFGDVYIRKLVFKEPDLQSIRKLLASYAS